MNEQAMSHNTYLYMFLFWILGVLERGTYLTSHVMQPICMNEPCLITVTCICLFFWILDGLYRGLSSAHLESNRRAHMTHSHWQRHRDIAPFTIGCTPPVLCCRLRVAVSSVLQWRVAVACNTLSVSPALKPCWNPAGVEPGNQEGLKC